MSLILSFLAVTAPVTPTGHIGQTMAQSPAVIMFHPPLDIPLVIEISDDRLLPDGSHVRFDIGYRLIFSVIDPLMIASLTPISLRCSGSSARCDAFLAALQPQLGRVRRYQITADGTVMLMPGTSGTGTDLATNAMVARVIDAARDGGDDVVMAELAEVTFFVGLALIPDSADSADPATSIIVSANSILVTQVETMAASPAHQAMVIQRTSEVDPATGLLMTAETVIHAGAPSSPIISRRRWTLHREIVAVP